MKCIKLRPNDVYFGRLRKGGDLIEQITSFCAENAINSGFFTAIGAVERAEVAYYLQDRKTYVQEKFDEPLELASCTGDITLKDGKPFVHAHACLSREDKSTVAGHLVSASVYAGEVFLTAFRNRLERRLDKATGLSLVETPLHKP